VGPDVKKEFGKDHKDSPELVEEEDRGYQEESMRKLVVAQKNFLKWFCITISSRPFAYASN
jgi:hypothetical protein